MEKLILVGIDLHDKNMVLKMALGAEKPRTQSVVNNAAGRRKLLDNLNALKAAGAKVAAAYEASGCGFGLRDQLVANGHTCHVLAPSKLPAMPKQHGCKTDEKDAEAILEVLRGHYLAGNKLPAVWVPDAQLRDDRELVRSRLDVQEKCTKLKLQIVTLLKRHELSKPGEVGGNWTKAHRGWLQKLAESEKLGHGVRAGLKSLLRQLKSLEEELERLDAELKQLAAAPRHAAAMTELRKLPAVGLLTALVFLTEVGDATRFKNRKQFGAYLGLAPSSYDSGERIRKGHITHQGPARLRYVLNQAVWNCLKCDPKEKATYERIAGRNPEHKKIAVVAGMRRLGVKMWHAAVRAQTQKIA